MRGKAGMALLQLTFKTDCRAKQKRQTEIDHDGLDCDDFRHAGPLYASDDQARNYVNDDSQNR
jgi:hypothetical protein